MSTDVENIVRKILEDMNSGDISSTESPQKNQSNGKKKSNIGKATLSDYPIAEKNPDWVETPNGKTFSDMTLENVLNGSITAEDLRITPDILKAQGDIAIAAGRPPIAENFGRGAELIAVPDDRILEIYNSLRPNRSSKQELLDIAEELETKYEAKITAEFVREAAENYEKRDKLKKND